MWSKWKSKLKAAIKEAKDKRKEKQSKTSSGDSLVQPVGAIDRQSDGLSRPHGLGGRRSLEVTPTSQGTFDAAGLAAANSTAAAGAAGIAGSQQLQQQLHSVGQPPQHGNSSLQQQQLDQLHANMMVQQQHAHHQQQQQHHHGHPSGLRPVDCTDRNTHGVDVLMQSCPASPSAQASAAAGVLHESSAAGADASTGGASAAVLAGNAAGARASTAAAAAGDHTEQGSTLGATATGQHRLDASRTPRDEELGTCPPYAAKAVWGLRYTMEDKWAAVPNLIQVPLVLTCPPKKSKGSKAASGCGCMIPAASAAASKVLSKVSPSSRLGSGGSSGGKDAKSGAAHGANPGLEKPSPDRQRLIGQGLSSSDEQGLASDPLSLGTAEGSSSSVEPMPGMDALHYFGVFDGHGGADAARHCAQRMHQTVCSTILSMLSPEVAAAAVVSILATSSRQPALDLAGQQQQTLQQQDEEAALLPAASAAAAAANDAASADSSSTSGAAMQPIPAIDIAASNGSWLLPALSRSFVALDREFGAISEGSYVGSTAVVVLIGSQRLWVAHAGDSRAVLGRGGTVQVLTSDHKASRDDEVARVQAAGGHVWWDRVMGELAVSRAIGDHCLRPYVIPEPELLMVERTAEDEVLVMASDGLWDVMNNQEAVDMAVHSLQAAQASGHAGVAAVKRSANALTKAALERGTRDNVTVLVIDLRPRKPGTYEAVAATSSTHHGSNHTSRHSSSSSGSRGHGRSSKKAASAAAAAPQQQQQTQQGAPAATGVAAAEAPAAAAAAPAGSKHHARDAEGGMVGGSSEAVAADTNSKSAGAAGPTEVHVQQTQSTESAGETRPLVPPQQQQACSIGAGI